MDALTLGMSYRYLVSHAAKEEKNSCHGANLCKGNPVTASSPNLLETVSRSGDGVYRVVAMIASGVCEFSRHLTSISKKFLLT